jgi:hypothetical protein
LLSVRNTDSIFIFCSFLSVLHPYYKLAYIKHAWGGPEEQAIERAAGNYDAKDWQDEARKIVESTVSSLRFYSYVN